MSGPKGVFIGREPELEVLRGVALRAVEGRATVALVTGEAGIGKTRIATELAQTLAAEGWWCPVSHGVAMTGGEVPFSGTTELVRALVNRLGEAEVRRLLGPAATVLASLVPSLTDDAPPTIDRSAVTRSVLTLFDRIGQPACWLLDDLQWMDGATHDLVSYLAKVATGNPLLLLGTVRTDVSATDRLPHELVELGRAGRVLTLAPLSKQHVAAQATALSDRTLTEEEVTRICAVSDGLPFFVEELVASGGQVSGSLPAVLHASLDRLSPTARTVVAAASVREGTLRASALQAVCNLDSAFDLALAEARSRGVLRVDPSTGELRFRHALLAEAVDRDLLAEERTRLHLRWAAHLERALEEEPDNPALLIARAHHRYAVGGPEAFGAVLAAARAADAADDDRVRRLWWARAMETWPAPTDQATLLERDRGLAALVGALWSVGDLGAAIEIVDAELAQELDWLRGLWLSLIRQMAVRSLPEQQDPVPPPTAAEAVKARLLVAPRDFRSTEVLVRLAASWSEELPDVALSLLEEAYQRLDTTPSRDVVNMLYELMAFLTLRRGTHERGIALLREYVDWAAEHDPGAVIDAQGLLGLGLANAGMYREAERVLENALEDLRDPELHPQLWFGHHAVLAMITLQTGAWSRTEQCLALALHGKSGRELATMREFAAAGLWVRRGDLDRARMHWENIAEPEAEEDPAGLPPVEALLRAFLALEVAAVEQRADEACTSYARFITVTNNRDRADDELEAYLLALRAIAVRDAESPDVQQLCAHGPAVLGLQGGSRVLPALRSEIAAHLKRVAGQDDAGEWSSIADSWAALDRPWDGAQARVWQAECALRDGDRDQGHDALAEAHALAVRLGAEPLRRRCQATARRSRVLGIGRAEPASVLTAREAEVLALVEQGRTNKEIAATLVISTKTVSVHISNILTKLGAANRTEAVTLARRDALLTFEPSTRVRPFRGSSTPTRGGPTAR